MKPLKLSKEQQDVVAYRDGDLQVIACAGSGKTESISRRIAALINDGVEPASIVAFTFTERAAAELKERIVGRVRELKGRDFLDRLGPMFVGTIHSYCFRLLQEHVPQFGNYDVLDEHRHAGLLSREYFGLPKAAFGHHWQWNAAEWIRTVDVIGNELIPGEKLGDSEVGRFYRAYREMLDRYHCLTFSLIIQRAVESLEDPTIYERVHGPLRHLVVDEYQDINPAQERLIELLARLPVQLCVVGDDDQCIYQWRGSDVRHILQFAKRRKKAQTIPLEVNRRSRPRIIETANAFAKNLPDRLPKRMKPERGPGPNEVVVWTAETPEHEAERIAVTIQRLRKLGYRYRDIAVLCRSVRTSGPPIIEACKAHKIPVAAGGRTGLFLQPEINLFGEIYAWFVDGKWKDERYGPQRDADLNHVVVGLSDLFGSGKPVAGLKKYFEDWKRDYLTRKQPVNLVGDFYKLLWHLGAHDIDVDGPDETGSARFGAFARFSNVLADFEHVYRRGRWIGDGEERQFQGGRDRGKEYLEALHRYLLYYARDAYEEFEGEITAETDAVDILTVHQAKGLEWPVVFVPALVRARFPSGYAGQPQQWMLDEDVFPKEKRRRYEGSIEDERRLFYVALTRARDCVYLSYFRRKKNKFTPSMFLVELSGENLPSPGKLPLPGPPEELKHEDLPPLELAFSDVAVFDDCGFRYRLGSVFGFEQQIAVELGYGKAIHHVLRRVADTARETGRVPDPDDLERLVRDEFYLPLANRPAFEMMHKAAQRLVRRYAEDHADDLRRVWATERPFELHLDDGTIAGRADVILDMEGGRIGSLAIVDYKVAAAEERDERYRQQLAVYTAAGRGEGLQVEAAYLHELATGDRNNVDVSSEATAQAVSRVADSVGNIRKGQFPARPDALRCRACDYHRICRHTAHKPEY